MTATIRALEPADRDGLEAALRSDDTFRGDEVSVALELIDEALSGSEDYWILVTECDDEPRIAGYLCCGKTPMTASTFDLYWIVTHARARGRGVARGLIEAMEHQLRARGGTGVRVETSRLESYGAARNLYDRCGYPEAARLRDFYRAGDDLVIYYKRL